MINQQTIGLNSGTAKKGCKYLCHGKIAELETGKDLTLDMINLDYTDHKKYGWLENEADVIKPNEIMKDFINDLGGTSTPKQIGRIVQCEGGSQVVFWDNTLNHIIKYMIVQYKTAFGYHWVLYDGLMNELYDPYTLPYERRYINAINLIG